MSHLAVEVVERGLQVPDTLPMVATQKKIDNVVYLVLTRRVYTAILLGVPIDCNAVPIHAQHIHICGRMPHA